MLIEFSVANYRSLKNNQTFTLMRNAAKEMIDTNTFTVNLANNFDLLRSAAIYGPNASGKSNLLRALSTMKKLITHSAKTQIGDQIPVEPYKLSLTASSEPTEFEATIINDGVRYQYGFSATTEKVYDEWLFAFPKGKAQNWFSRVWNEKLQDYDWNYSNYFLGEKQVWQKSTRNNALFLSTAIQLNNKQLRPVYEWFEKKLSMLGAGGVGVGFTSMLCEDNDEKKQTLDFLKAADLGINDLEVKSELFDPASLPDDMPAPLKEIFTKEMKDHKVVEVSTVHFTDTGDKVVFDLEEESDGTKRFFEFAGPWINCLKKGNVLFVDELNNHLHPKLVEFLVSLFHDSKINTKNAQLVFTTHETSILNQNMFRRDQIWFCEKEHQKGTRLFPLSDFNPRKDRENLELAYLSGRYGALPLVNFINLSSKIDKMLNNKDVP